MGWLNKRRPKEKKKEVSCRRSYFLQDTFSFLIGEILRISKIYIFSFLRLFSALGVYTYAYHAEEKLFCILFSQPSTKTEDL